MIQFEYYATFETEEKTPPARGLICAEVTLGPPIGVTWSQKANGWIFNPYVTARWVFDDMYQERRSLVSRGEAERIARERYGVELPSEEELHRIDEEGDRARARKL